MVSIFSVKWKQSYLLKLKVEVSLSKAGISGEWAKSETDEVSLGPGVLGQSQLKSVVLA